MRGAPGAVLGSIFFRARGTSKRRPSPGRLAPRDSTTFMACAGVSPRHGDFFRMSRSSWRIRFSLRRRANSSRSAVVRPVLPPVRSARARSTHSRSAVGTKSSSRATVAIDLPSSRTSRAACSLNSSENLRRARRFGVSEAMVDIVSAFQKVSTKPDQVHLARLRGSTRLRTWAASGRGGHPFCARRVRKSTTIGPRLSRQVVDRFR